MSKIIIAANRLPVSISGLPKNPALVPSPGGMAAALEPVFSNNNCLWVGYSGASHNLTKNQLTALGLADNLLPVAIPGPKYHQYYNAVANGVFWPMLHGFKPAKSYGSSDWEAYRQVNQLFAKVIVENLKSSDVIWVHDYHLFLLPKYLRRLGVTNPIGFFLHVPFAAGRLINSLPDAAEVQSSLQSADLCGVQTSRDAGQLQKFIKSSGPKPGFISKVKVFPVGIDYQKYHGAKASQETLTAHTLILSVSRLDYTKGILQQLKAFEQLLAGGRYSGKVVYKLIVSPSREAIVQYQQLKKDVRGRVQNINKRYGRPGWQPVDYEYRNVAFSELIALYGQADIMLVAPLIDGMNLVAKEYIAAGKNGGVLVLSKSAGAAQQLKNALLVNPKAPREISAALAQAMAMPAAERKHRHNQMLRVVKKYDAANWAQSFLQNLTH